MERCSISVTIIREMQVVAIIKINKYTEQVLAKTWRNWNTCTAGRKTVQPLRKTVQWFLGKLKIK